jgi:protein-S-isoprenylcysteine O-methyltransferase Ste14
VGMKDLTLTMSRRTAVAVWFVGVAAVHIGLPIAVAATTRRAALRGPLGVRFAGVTSLVTGLAGLSWSSAQHFEAAPEEGYKMALTPDYLLESGPYRFSRNPMYVAEVAIWAGWSLVFTNPVLLGATTLVALGLGRAARVEEAAMAARFGDAWSEYTAATPRWLGSHKGHERMSLPSTHVRYAVRRAGQDYAAH